MGWLTVAWKGLVMASQPTPPLIAAAKRVWTEVHATSEIVNACVPDPEFDAPLLEQIEAEERDPR
jgi:hypothetical protein